jgi:hypothetical protein
LTELEGFVILLGEIVDLSEVKKRTPARGRGENKSFSFVNFQKQKDLATCPEPCLS